MTADELQRRIDAWLAARDAWTSETARRKFLVGQWRHICPVFGADSDAAKGVLLGIVAEAWGDPDAYVVRLIGHARRWRLHVRDRGGARHGFTSDDSKSGAMLAALEAAP